MDDKGRLRAAAGHDDLISALICAWHAFRYGNIDQEVPDGSDAPRERKGATFRLPQKQANVLYRLERSRQALGRELERPPSDQELAEELGMDQDEVRLLLSSNQNILSLNEPVGDESEAEFGDLLEQYVIPDTDEEILRQSFEDTLREALAKLSEKERQILSMRFGLGDDNPRTLREIGDALGISRERVRQIENQALTKLRRGAQSRALAGYLI